MVGRRGDRQRPVAQVDLVRRAPPGPGSLGSATGHPFPAGPGPNPRWTGPIRTKPVGRLALAQDLDRAVHGGPLREPHEVETAPRGQRGGPLLGIERQPVAGRVPSPPWSTASASGGLRDLGAEPPEGVEVAPEGAVRALGPLAEARRARASSGRSRGSTGCGPLPAAALRAAVPPAVSRSISAMLGERRSDGLPGALRGARSRTSISTGRPKAWDVWRTGAERARPEPGPPRAGRAGWEAWRG